MTDNINNIYIRSNSLLKSRQLPEFFEALRQVADQIDDGHFAKDIAAVESTYFYMLRFVASGGQTDIAKAAAELADRAQGLLNVLRRHVLEQDKRSLRGAQLRYRSMRPEENLSSLFSDYLSELQRLRSAGLTLDSAAKAHLEQLASDIFRFIWSAVAFDDDEQPLIASMLTDGDIPQGARVLWTHALGLGLEPDTDGERLKLLFDALATDNAAVAAAAQTWLSLAALGIIEDTDPDVAAKIYDALEAAYPGDTTRIGLRYLALLEKKGATSPEDRLTKEDFEYMQRIADGQIAPDDVDEKFKERANGFFNKQIASGADFMAPMYVPMYVLPFFGSAANWFLPYDPEHSALSELNEGEGAEITDNIAQINFLCDIDKYATALSITAAPAPMRASMMTAIIDRMRSFTAMTGMDIAETQPELDHERLIANSLLTIRRFSIYGTRNERYNISGAFTACRLDSDSAFARRLDGENILKAADTLLALGYTRQAIGYYELLPEDELSADVLVAMSHAGDFDAERRSIELLGKALGAAPDREDIALELARRVESHSGPDAALKVFEGFLQATPDSLAVLKAQMDLLERAGRYDDAMLVGEHIHYLDSDNTSILVDLVRLKVLAGDYETAGLLAGMADEALDEHPGLTVAMLWGAGQYAEAMANIELYRDNKENLQAIRDQIIQLASKASLDQAKLMAAADVIYYLYTDNQFGKII